MEIYLEKTNKTKTIKIKKPAPIKEILKNLKISTNSVIIIKNNKICLEDEKIEDTDKIKLLSVVSGG